MLDEYGDTSDDTIDVDPLGTYTRGAAPTNLQHIFNMAPCHLIPDLCYLGDHS